MQYIIHIIAMWKSLWWNHDVWWSVERLALGIDDGDEVWFEWRAADKKPVDVWLLCQLLAVISWHWTCHANTLHSVSSVQPLLTTFYVTTSFSHYSVCYTTAAVQDNPGQLAPELSQTVTKYATFVVL